ncbi:MAG: SurA N-terminal domain-containing protein [Eubacteriales bacterium]|nr:SurA N-terminal domain-containing protein [Eubacteriales bacterium]
MKKTIAMLLTCIMVMSVLVMAGCQVAPAPQDEAAGTQAAGDAAAQDGDTVVATVGESKITLADFQKLFDQYSYYYSMFGMDVSSDPSMLAEFRTMVKNALLEKEIIKYQAKLQQLETLSEAQLKEIEESAENTISQMREQFSTMAGEAKASDDTIDVEKYINDMIADEAEYATGKAMTADEYKEWLKTEASVTHLRDNLMDVVCKDVTVTQEDLDAWYAENLATEKETYANDPAAYKTAAENYACGSEDEGYLPPVYAPEGYSRVMDMLVKPRVDVNEANPDYSEKIQTLNNLQMEYGTLSFEDAVGASSANKDRMQAIIAEYKSTKAETDRMEEEAGKEAKAIIEEAYAKLTEGATFESLLIRYTENEAAASCETLMMDGLLINPSIVDEAWSNECVTEFKKLKVGEYSPIFLDDDGYHILYYVGDEEAGERPLADVQEAVKAHLMEDKRYESWQTILAEWMKDESVTVNDDVINTVGA